MSWFDEGRLMKSMADGLPPHVRADVHADWFKNEQDYWAVRDSLLAHYEGQWIAFDDGKVIAHGRSRVTVHHQGRANDRHPFLVNCGAEVTGLRMRRRQHRYDTSYPTEPLIVVDAEFRIASGVAGSSFHHVLVDTGADSSALPWSDFKLLGLKFDDGTPGYITGVGGMEADTLVYILWVYIDSKEYGIEAQADFEGNERILGRDILNCMRVLLDGPGLIDTINP